MTMSCEWMAADPLDSADCPTFARGSACAVRRRLRPPHAAAAAAAAWMRCSAGFGLGPDSGSEVELEALRPPSFKLLCAVGLLSVDLSVTELDSGSVARSDSACVCVKMAECRSRGVTGVLGAMYVMYVCRWLVDSDSVACD